MYAGNIILNPRGSSFPIFILIYNHHWTFLLTVPWVNYKISWHWCKSWHVLHQNRLFQVIRINGWLISLSWINPLSQIYACHFFSLTFCATENRVLVGRARMWKPDFQSYSPSICWTCPVFLGIVRSRDQLVNKAWYPFSGCSKSDGKGQTKKLSISMQYAKTRMESKGDDGSA